MAKQNNVRYLWFIMNTPPVGEDRCYYFNGQWFAAYLTEPNDAIIYQYKMLYVGMGDGLFPETYNIKHSQTT